MYIALFRIIGVFYFVYFKWWEHAGLFYINGNGNILEISVILDESKV
jgi:hypothetical protein